MKPAYLLAGAAAIVVFLVYRSGPKASFGVSHGPPDSGDALPERTAVATQESLTKGQFLKGHTLAPPGTGVINFGSQALGGMKILPTEGALVPPGSFPSYRKR